MKLIRTVKNFYNTQKKYRKARSSSPPTKHKLKGKELQLLKKLKKLRKSKKEMMYPPIIEQVYLNTSFNEAIKYRFKLNSSYTQDSKKFLTIDLKSEKNQN